MAKLNNPTRTLSIEKRWMREINKRYSSLQKDINEKLREVSGPIQTNATIGLNTEQQKLFMAWLLERIKLVTGDEPPLNWQNQYQIESYIRAVESTRASLISQEAELSLTDAEIVQSQGFEFTAVPTLGSAVVAPVIHQDALEFIFTRAYESLKGWNDAFAKEVRQITFDAVKSGQGIAETTKQIQERVGVTKSRAQNIAATEIGQAYKEAAINETDRASEEIGEKLDVRWISALKPNTRHRHAGWHGEIISTEEARKRKQGVYLKSDIYRCQCSITPVVPGYGDTPKKNEKFKIQRAEFIEWEKKQDKQ